MEYAFVTHVTNIKMTSFAFIIIIDLVLAHTINKHQEKHCNCTVYYCITAIQTKIFLILFFYSLLCIITTSIYTVCIRTDVSQWQLNHASTSINTNQTPHTNKRLTKRKTKENVRIIWQKTLSNILLNSHSIFITKTIIC